MAYNGTAACRHQPHGHAAHSEPAQRKAAQAQQAHTDAAEAYNAHAKSPQRNDARGNIADGDDAFCTPQAIAAVDVHQWEAEQCVFAFVFITGNNVHRRADNSANRVWEPSPASVSL